MSRAESTADPAKTCRHWLNGNCRWGEQCKYLHEGTQGAVSAPRPKKEDKWCNKVFGGCCAFGTHGNKCEYWHLGDWVRAEQRPRMPPLLLKDHAYMCRAVQGALERGFSEGTLSCEPFRRCGLELEGEQGSEGVMKALQSVFAVMLDAGDKPESRLQLIGEVEEILGPLLAADVARTVAHKPPKGKPPKQPASTARLALLDDAIPVTQVGASDTTVEARVCMVCPDTTSPGSSDLERSNTSVAPEASTCTSPCQPRVNKFSKRAGQRSHFEYLPTIEPLEDRAAATTPPVANSDPHMQPPLDHGVVSQADSLCALYSPVELFSPPQTPVPSFSLPPKAFDNNWDREPKVFSHHPYGDSDSMAECSTVCALCNSTSVCVPCSSTSTSESSPEDGCVADAMSIRSPDAGNSLISAGTDPLDPDEWTLAAWM